jgi:Na+/H+ antiporter NhaD/arsenite permease-like protein
LRHADERAHAIGNPMSLPVPIEFVIFGLTLLAIAVWHQHSMVTAVAGLVAVVAYKLAFTDFGLFQHLRAEAVSLLNLLGLLLGFAILAAQFVDSRIADKLPDVLPNDWKGGLVLLVIIAVMSSFLDNIAAALIGSGIASVVYRKRLHIGYLAAIVGASNAGGAFSPVGDTTTTMIWISGVPGTELFRALIGAAVSVTFMGVVAAKQQQAYEPITKDADPNVKIDFVRAAIVVAMLVGAIVANVVWSLPAIGVWAAILLGSTVRPAPWVELPAAMKGSVFLLSLVIMASFMPVERLPAASWHVAFGLGFVSAVFDNIPLTKLAITQGGYDWALLAYAVGFGGSMIWFGSSAGVALTSRHPEARSAVQWVKGGWHVAVAYVLGFFAMLATWGWLPDAR